MTNTLNPIAKILDIAPVHQTFTFEGHSFEYHPAGDCTFETLYTRWADAPRAVSADTLNGPTPAHALAVLLSHKFRKGVSASERDAILKRFKAARVAQRGAAPTIGRGVDNAR